LSGSATRRFAGRVVIVTGAGSGMGRRNALRFAEEGATVVANDVNAASVGALIEELARSKAEAMVAVGSVADVDAVGRMVQGAISRFGKVDVLVNNAGIGPTTRPLERIGDDEWERTIGIDLTGVFNCMRAVLPGMKERRYGKIVNISSSAGRSVSTFGGAHYTAAKAGVLGLTRHAAYEYAPYNININAIAPGTIDTELLRGAVPADRIEQEAMKIPLRRLGTVDDESNLVLFLASEESSYITGATIDINGADLLL
jgi:NAD(P)-dependent dehydrogenase (short-subunit alcohol dehydrogenase family)